MVIIPFFYFIQPIISETNKQQSYEYERQTWNDGGNQRDMEILMKRNLIGIKEDEKI